jgi:hypothetical protein
MLDDLELNPLLLDFGLPFSTAQPGILFSSFASQERIRVWKCVILAVDASNLLWLHFQWAPIFVLAPTVSLGRKQLK